MGFISWGRTPFGRGEAAPFPEDGKLFTSFSNHVDRGDPYPTLTRRAQFLIEHPWFVEAGEDLPVHKDPPPMGGPRPLHVDDRPQSLVDPRDEHGEPGAVGDPPW